MKKSIINCIKILSVFILLAACKKEFLEKRSSSAINVPSTLEELNQLLVNKSDIAKSPAIGELSSDDYYMTTTDWSSQYLPYFANSYVWAKDIFEGGGGIADWNVPYTQVLYANVVLERLNLIERTAANQSDYDDLKARALFLRSWSFFDLAQIFSPPYDEQTAGSDAGIPLRLTADIGAPTTRATVRETYNRVIADLQQSRLLIKLDKSPIDGYLPSRAAVYGLLSRVYLTMRNYPKAGIYADSALRIKSNLINFNSLSTTATIPMTTDHQESVYQNFFVPANPLSYVVTSQGYSIDSVLYATYDNNDLRKVIFFSPNGKYINKKRGYSGGTIISNGIATDELYLIRAECSARVDEPEKALADLNTLLINRLKTGAFVPVTGLQGKVLLDRILLERRKELVFRGLRWNDLRRLNKEGFQIFLKRNIADRIITLEPNDARYTLPIPPDVIALSGIQQNNR